MGRRRLDAHQAVLIDRLLVLLSVGLGLWRDVGFEQRSIRLFALPVWVYAAVQIAGGLLLLARRSHPVAVTAGQAALCLLSPTQAAYVAAYSLGVHARRSSAAMVAGVALLLGWILGARLWELTDPITGPVVLVCAALVGLWIRARRDLVDSLVDRAERAEREQQMRTELALAADRSRLAREMHDEVGHWLSMVVLRASVLEVATTVPDDRAAAVEIQEHGRGALRALASMLDLLRSGDPDAAPRAPARSVAPVDEDLGELVARARSAGLRVEVDSQGEPGQAPAATARTVLRVVQEGLTNAARHAPGSDVRVVLSHRREDTTVELANSAPEAGGPVWAGPDTRGSGSVGPRAGLRGLRERVELVGGCMTTTSRDDGGFVLRVTVPVDPPVSS